MEWTRCTSFGLRHVLPPFQVRWHGPKNRSAVINLSGRTAALRTPNLKEVNSGAKVSTLPFAGTIVLAPSSSASLPKAPERSPKIDTFSGYLEIAGVKAGTYSISLDDAAWVDVVGDNQFLKAKAHSGVQGCHGIRKVLQFELRADPLIVQISGAPTQRLNVAIMPSE